MDSPSQSNERPRTGSQRKRSDMKQSNSTSISGDINTDSIRRPKSAPKPITPSSKDRPTRKSDGSTSGIINSNSNSNRPRSKNRPKRARKKRPSGPPLKGSKDDLLAKRLGLRSFKNTTPQDLQTIMSMNVSVEDAKELGKIAVKEKNWELAEVAYNLCVEKPAYGTEGRHQRGHQQRVSKSAVTSDYPQLSPIKTRERYSRPHTQQSSRSSRSRRRNRTSQTKQMLDYELNWKKGTAGVSWNSTSSRRGSMDSRNSLRSRSSPKLFNFLDNEHPPPFMSRETLLRLSAPRKYRKPPPLNNIPCEASGRWKGRQGGRFSTSKPKSDVEWIIYRSKQVPGPSHYRPKLVEPNKGVRFSDANPKSDVDWIIHRSKKTPGPGQYPLKSTLAGGGVKFSDANPKSDLEWTIYNASQVPGPARYNIELCP